MNLVPIWFQSTSKGGLGWMRIQFASPQTELWTQSVHATNAYWMCIEFGSSVQCEKAFSLWMANFVSPPFHKIEDDSLQMLQDDIAFPGMISIVYV